MSNTKSQKLKAKDLISIGIFSGIYFIIALASNVLGGLHAIVWFLSPCIAALLCGIPFMILASKVKKPFTVMIMGIVVGLLFLITGQFHILVPITFFVTSCIVEIIRYVTKYTSFKGNAVGFSIFALSMVASPLPLWIDSESFISRIKEFGMPQSYIDTVTSLTSTSMLITMILLTLISGLIGSLITKSMFKKHFKKAGVVA
ncbi:MAG: MptD family putative ECF transporter S component [Vallitalea sp.]|jgi:energy-coupling factor transport system substrate-specific component|nr:MptD family putative ECF transporter S component [Vallitalea sp.]